MTTATKHSRATHQARVSSTPSHAMEEGAEDFQDLVESVGASVGAYCRKRPLVASLTVFALGFYTGWKIKPW